MAHLRSSTTTMLPHFLAPRFPIVGSSRIPAARSQTRIGSRLPPPPTFRRLASTTTTTTSSSSSTIPPPSSLPLSPSLQTPTSSLRHTLAQTIPAKTLRERVLERQEELYKERAVRVRSVFLYGGAVLVLGFGITYAAVPLYRAFCSATGFGGSPITSSERFDPSRMVPYSSSSNESSYGPDGLPLPNANPNGTQTRRNKITVHFEATASDTLKWRFTPQQRFVKVLPGETALAFYTAENWGDEDVVGIATYNTTPGKMAPYFAKVECFCFEQQKIRAGETVDLPVFFFIDRDIDDDPTLAGLDDVVLSYTFFKARRNQQGHMEPDAPLDVVEKAAGFEGYELAKR